MINVTNVELTASLLGNHIDITAWYNRCVGDSVIDDNRNSMTILKIDLQIVSYHFSGFSVDEFLQFVRMIIDDKNFVLSLLIKSLIGKILNGTATQEMCNCPFNYFAEHIDYKFAKSISADGSRMVQLYKPERLTI